MSKRKSLPSEPPSEPRYEILAQGDPPRPVYINNNDEDAPTAPPRKSPPRRGPKTAAGKKRSSQNSTKHGLCQDIRHFKVLPDEDQSVYEDSVGTLLTEIDPWDSTTEHLADNIARTRWHIYRADFRFEAALERENGDFINVALKFERYRASSQRRLNQMHKLLAELRAAHKKEEQPVKAEAPKLPELGPDGKPYEIDREYLICKFCNNPSPRHYIHNFATEKIHMSKGKPWFARTIPLVELMEGEFFLPQYGLGAHFTEAFKEWRKTHKLYHPGEPYVTKKWPPPIPDNCPPDDWFMDEELTLAEDPIVILKQRAARMQEEERLQLEEKRAELKRQIEEARLAEEERQRLELEEELRPKQYEEDEDEEPDRDDHPQKE